MRTRTYHLGRLSLEHWGRPWTFGLTFFGSQSCWAWGLDVGPWLIVWSR